MRNNIFFLISTDTLFQYLDGCPIVKSQIHYLLISRYCGLLSIFLRGGNFKSLIVFCEMETKNIHLSETVSDKICRKNNFEIFIKSLRFVLIEKTVFTKLSVCRLLLIELSDWIEIWHTAWGPKKKRRVC